MKYAAPILLFSLLYLNGFAQNADGTDRVKDRLYSEITSYHQVEFKHIGCWGSLSKFFPKVDSFFKLSTPTACIDYFDDDSYILKYYSFYRILFVVRNDSIAWDKLTTFIKDSTHVAFDDWVGYVHFNKILAQHYYAFLYCKYRWYLGTYKGVVYQFDRPGNRKRLRANKRIFKRKKKELWTLLEANGMDADKLMKFY
jgi:hypothetical protein